jgi:hypothetical protein
MTMTVLTRLNDTQAVRTTINIERVKDDPFILTTILTGPNFTDPDVPGEIGKTITKVTR